jgi:hypothetical protein
VVSLITALVVAKSASRAAVSPIPATYAAPAYQAPPAWGAAPPPVQPMPQQQAAPPPAEDLSDLDITLR